ncbi:glycosyltransferase [Desulfovibrio sp. JC010]|uniref:CgeB family protein n=1 Tax=Desulfovibrio sp. JC010 TaxID=2593641 RepID=UPI0013CF9B11|nr:glycosyltransferase [Desulfovibrio sp. JC010]NDV28883.1 glycosyltransferase [Desulfovibrio sp. JC010]
MKDKLNVCVVGSFSAGVAALRQLGHTVLHITYSGEPFCNLPEILEKNDFIPDLLLQVEDLGKRTLIQGLDALDCPTIFWATDPHLNLHWHSPYGKLFDLTLSTQQAMVPFFKADGLSNVRWLPVYAPHMDSPPVSGRKNDIVFVGRLSDQRPARTWMVEFIRSRIGDRNFSVEQSLSYAEMLELYQDTKIIPNESILGEVNFRLFEGTACGCLLLTQDLGDEQASLFKPGREIETYSDVLELEEKLKLYLGNDSLIQKMGQAAYERVQSEHLAVHRIERILQYADDAVRSRAEGAEAEKWFAITAAAMWESGLLDVPLGDVTSNLSALLQDPQVVVATLRVQAVAGFNSLLEKNIMTLLGGNLFENSFDLNLTGSTAALRLNNWDGAKAFWYRHLKGAGKSDMLPPKTPKDLLILWAKELKYRNRLFRGGFPFDFKRHLPNTAVDCLMSLHNACPDDVEILKLLDVMLRSRKELDQVRGNFLSALIMHGQHDWRLIFESALTDLRSYRLEPGMEKILLAKKIARKNGQERAFAMALKGRDESGLISVRMGEG